MRSRTARRLLLFLLPLLFACGGDRRADTPAVARDLAEIRARDTLTVLTTFNSTSYFLYRGEPMGYEYELLQRFAKDLGVELKTVVVRDREQLLDMLNRGEGDVVAARLVPTAAHRERAAFTQALYNTPPALVQRGTPGERVELPEAVDTLLRTGTLPDTLEIRARLVTRPSQLAGEEVHVPEGAAYQARLAELSDELTGDIHVVEVDSTAEALIRTVSRGGIEFTVAPANVARLKESYFTNVIVRPTLGPPLQVAWAVRKNAPGLLTEFDRWIETQKGSGLFREMYEKYFIDRQGYRERVESEYLTSETGRLSKYDELFKRHASALGWDWRLLASQAYQESRFDPAARSWAGALGLLQLMPSTARAVGVKNPADPEENVRGSVRFTGDLIREWESRIPDPRERLRFILAAYNTGTGHVEDAQRLTEKHGGNPTAWSDVAYWLTQKSKREVYTDPVVKHGFSRGLEPVLYVSRVLERFDHYRQFVRSE
jgi:membrane-bound lytic murein transglycosylase F